MRYKDIRPKVGKVMALLGYKHPIKRIIHNKILELNVNIFDYTRSSLEVELNPGTFQMPVK